jgi:hypothetical protein
MTKEELIKLSRENLRKSKQGSLCECYDEAFIKGYELSKKRIAELEEKISVLLSCKNCPENKGGYICEKEYENKCLAQKIQYIKELQEENTELKDENQKWKDEWQEQVQKANDESYARTLQTMQLTTAKEIISEWEDSFCRGADYLYLGNKSKELRIKAQKFLNSEVEK